MKRSQLLAVTVVALFVLSSLPVQVAVGASGYTEKLNVYVAGSSALWYFTFGGVNGSGSLSAFESTPGLASYNVTAIKTVGWSSDFQVFGPRGYNLLPVPFIPSQGLFLTLGSDSFAHASASAAALDPYLLTSFTSYSNGTGSFVFYSPISFNDLVPNTLLRFLPSTEGGFASAITSASLTSSGSPFVVLEGKSSSSSGFDHTLVVGGISSSALSGSQPNLMSYFGSGVSFLQAANKSSSSTVQLNFLDGMIKSSDHATVANDGAKFTSSYSLSLAAGKRLSKVNATVAQVPAALLATRAVDVGVLKTGGNVSITLGLRNLSPSLTISRVSFTDNWWNRTGVFRLLSGSGSDSVASLSLAPGSSITPVYRLQYTGTAAQSMVIPASVVRYQYTVNGVAFNATATFNPIRLSLGVDDAVVFSTLTPTGGFGKPVGSPQSFNVTVTNVGTLPANSVVVAGHSIAGLAANGGTASVSVSQTAAGLLGTNSTTGYSTTYQDPSGATLNATTNAVSDIFSHTSMNIAFMMLTVAANIASLANQHANVTLALTVFDAGTANVTAFSATGALPAGLGCGAISGSSVAKSGVTCTGGALKIAYPVLNASSSLTTYMQYDLAKPQNFMLQPLSFQGTTTGGSVSGMSNLLAVPAGLVVSKQFAPSQLFGGMGSTATITATNAGPLPVYNGTIASTVDSFDSVASTAVLSKKGLTISPQGNATLSYGVTLQEVSGTQTATPATATFYFGGTPFSIQSQAPTLSVYQPLVVSISTSPANPVEGKNFTIDFLITNPTGVQVSNVTFALPVPSGLGLSGLVNAKVSGGILTISAPTLGAHGNITASARAVASSGITVPFSGASLKFSYSGTTISGTVPKSSGIGIAEDVTTRYIIPTAFILIAVFAVAYYVRRKALTAPSSQK
ncbi:MAG: hypothetical protein JRM80_08760 [Nitrososphaerota archaeon]|nr:hypothetical protein [Nitrososphaerota archaeon]